MFEKLISERISLLFRHRSLQNFFFLFLIQASNLLVSLITMPLLIQRLGVAQFGLVNLSMSVVFMVNVLVTFGYNLSGPREIAINQQDKDRLSIVASRIFFSKALLAIVVALVIIGLIFNTDFFSGYKEILFFSLLLLFSEASSSAWFFQGLEKMKMASLANVFSRLLYLLALVLYVTRPEDAKWANLYLGSTALTINLLLLFYIHYQLRVCLFLPQLKEIGSSLKSNFALFLSGFAGHISVHGGLIVLSFFASASLLGMFSLAERITMVLRMIPTLITQAIYPNASKLFESSLISFYQFLSRIYLGGVFASLIVTLVVWSLAPQIIWLFSKDELASSVGFLRILAFVPFLASLNIPNMILILVSNQKDVLFKSTWILGVYMILSATALSFYFGGKGLAYALISTELITFAVCSALIRQKSPDIFNGFYRSAFGGHYSR